MSYLVGDISVLLAFKIQIQGAWVIVSLQKCEKGKKGQPFYGLCSQNGRGVFIRGQSIKVFDVINIVKDTNSITKTMMIVKVT